MNVYSEVIFMTIPLGQCLFYITATFKTSMICITIKYRPIYKTFRNFRGSAQCARLERIVMAHQLAGPAVGAMASVR